MARKNHSINLVGPQTRDGFVRGGGRLHRIAVNRVVATATLIIRDSTSSLTGEILATITLAAGDSVGSIEYGRDFGTGLSVVTTAAAVDFTIVYSADDQTERRDD